MTYDEEIRQRENLDPKKLQSAAPLMKAAPGSEQVTKIELRPGAIVCTTEKMLDEFNRTPAAELTHLEIKEGKKAKEYYLSHGCIEFKNAKIIPFRLLNLEESFNRVRFLSKAPDGREIELWTYHWDAKLVEGNLLIPPLTKTPLWCKLSGQDKCNSEYVPIP